MVHHLVLVVRHVLHGAIDSSEFLRVHVRVLVRNAHLILTLSCSTIVKSEEVCFGVVALVRHGLIALLARITGRLELSIVGL